MPQNTTNMGLGKAIDADNARDYLATILAAALDVLDGHDHSDDTKGLVIKRVFCGLAAERPEAGHPGWVYVATDTGVFSFDTGAVWVDVLSLVDGVITADLIGDKQVTLAKLADDVQLVPPGMIAPYGGANAPTGWLLCDGSAVSRTTYAALFQVIGTTYGTGDGSSTFNLPNAKGRVLVGLDAGQSEFDALGKTGGAKTHTLQTAEMPSHSHTASGTTDGQGSHSHTIDSAGTHSHNGNFALGIASGSFTGIDTWAENKDVNVGQHQTALPAGAHSHTAQAAGSHSHNVSVTVNATGNGGAHNNLQPYLVTNYIIKA